MTVEGEIVLTRDQSSGRIHKRVLLEGGSLASFEACNLDEAGAYSIVLATDLTDADPRCGRCFPVVGASDSFTAVAQPPEDSITL